jgi:hypothetical protein
VGKSPQFFGLKNNFNHSAFICVEVYQYIANLLKPNNIIMKRLAPFALVILLSLTAGTTFAQKMSAAKPTLFAAYPSAISCKETELSDVFKTSNGKNVSIDFAGSNTNFSGVVISNIAKRNNLQYIAVKLPSLDNAIMSISKRIDENNNVSYIGHIINPKNSDAYELKKMKDGQYQFVKTDLEKLMPACTQQ